MMFPESSSELGISLPLRYHAELNRDCPDITPQRNEKQTDKSSGVH